MDSGEYRVLIIYDIVNDRRRTKYAEFLEGYGYRIQKSCFEALLTRKMYKTMIRKTPEYFDKEEDSIRIYVLNGYRGITCFGKPEEVVFDKTVIL